MHFRLQLNIRFHEILFNSLGDIVGTKNANFHPYSLRSLRQFKKLVRNIQRTINQTATFSFKVHSTQNIHLDKMLHNHISH